MSNHPAASAAASYAPAYASINNAQNSAIGLAAATPPKTYQFDPNAANQTAALLSRSQVLQNQQALQERSPAAFAGQESAIKDLTGGVAGDDSFLRNAALKSGLETAGSQGTVGMGSITAPVSAGGVTAGKIFGSQLLNYRNMRDQQALGVAKSLQPDAAINPADAIGLQTQSGMQGVQNANDYNAMLSQMRLGQVSNLQNQTQQAEGLQQQTNNANNNSANANTQGLITAGLTAASAAAVIL
jgi:hypothetical protein